MSRHYCYTGFGSAVTVEANIYKDGKGVTWECIRCALPEAKTPARVHTPSEMLVHLREHRLAGDKVPKGAEQKLAREISAG